MVIAMEILASVIILFLVGSIIYHKAGALKFFYHDLLGWCAPENGSDTWYDGCSVHATCKYCKREIMQDSQGNWF